ncbi:hypothetical protein GCM10011380_01220 [Sphingomonas metalli]|uniref:Energy transducer TonB n=1 Tax=Sphingomonas metalli TaxID=1779358 RepID=A0A916WNU7_9SPHN|nr:hypothetical protein [Sphingomonas metalli]GGB15547.1 hypothetical protein GCM10011380_01220 [Sphingomonas metalli]
MASSSYRPAPQRQGHHPVRRALSFALAVGAHILVILLLLRLAPDTRTPPEEPPLNTFTLDADRPNARAAVKATKVTRTSAQSASASSRAATPPPLPTPKPTEEKVEWPTMLAENFDLAKVPKGSRGQAADEGRGDTDARGDSAAAYGPGAGPGGARLYNADWQREPTSAEINGYLRKGAPPDSWAEIACQTVPDNRVDNCRVLGESPIGSGLGRSMREAAWQFRILPPRIGGQKQIGAWVRIRISWTGRGADVR